MLVGESCMKWLYFAFGRVMNTGTQFENCHGDQICGAYESKHVCIRSTPEKGRFLEVDETLYGVVTWTVVLSQSNWHHVGHSWHNARWSGDIGRAICCHSECELYIHPLQSLFPRVQNTDPVSLKPKSIWSNLGCTSQFSCLQQHLCAWIATWLPQVLLVCEWRLLLLRVQTDGLEQVPLDGVPCCQPVEEGYEHV